MDAQSPYSYDPQFSGIEKERHCTDILCCLVFVAYIVGMLGIIFATIPHSNYKYLYIPTDHRGLLCGYDNSKLKLDDSRDLPDLTDSEYLFWIRPGKTGYSRSFCVDACPDTGYFTDAFISIAFLGSDLKGYSQDHVCGDVNNSEVHASIVNYSAPEGQEERFFCPYASEAVMRRCLPTSEAFTDVTDQVHQANISSLLSEFTTAMDAATVLARVVQDFYDTLWVLAVSVVAALVISLVWLLLLRWLAGCVIWTTVLLSLAALAFLTILVYNQWQDNFQNHQTIEAYSFGFASKDLNQKVFKGFFITLVVLDVIFVVVLIFMISRIKLAIRIIKMVAEMFSKIPGLFFFPVFLYLIMFAWWVIICAGAFVLFGAGTPERALVQTIEGDPLSVVDKITLKYDEVLQGMAIYHFVGFLWVTFFLVALGEMTVGGVVSEYYFTRPNERTDGFYCNGIIWRAFWRALRYHTGSLALGSAIITICRLIRIALEYIDQQAKDKPNMALLQFIIKCLKCCMWCLEKFLKYLNRNAYILIACHGYSFCPACAKSFGLLFRNAARVSALNWVGDFALFLGRVFVACLVTGFSLQLFPIAKPDVQCVVLQALIVLVCAWFATAAFTSIFELGIDALFLCYLEDGERNDGSPGREQYAPPQLTEYVDSNQARPPDAHQALL